LPVGLAALRVRLATLLRRSGAYQTL